MPGPLIPSLRLFVAVSLPARVRDELSRYQQDLKASGADVKWVEPQNIHLTLKFLGDTPNAKVAAIETALQDIFGAQPAVPLRLDRLGSFPSAQAPRVVWVGLRDDRADLEKMAGALEAGLAGLGFPKEGRPFRPHITLGRVRSPRNRLALSQRLLRREGALPAETFLADNITLFQSTLQATGPLHTVLRRVDLKTVAPA